MSGGNIISIGTRNASVPLRANHSTRLLLVPALLATSNKKKIMNQRILGRRYPLNKSRSTWLEVGISIVPRPAIQIALINKRNQEVVLSEDAWYELEQKKDSIMGYLSDNNKAKLPDEKLGDVTLIYGKVDSNNALCFHLPDEEVIILRETCENLFRMHNAVLNAIDYLDIRLETVSNRLNTFKNIVKNLGIKSASNVYEAIVSDKKYNKQSMVDTELVTLCLDGLLWNAAQ